MRINGSSHVYRRQVSAKRWRRERLRRFLDGDFPGDLSALRFSNCYVQRVAVSFRGFSLYVSFLSVRGREWIAEVDTHLAQVRGSGFNRADFVHCGHCGRAGVAANVHAQLRPTARANHDRQRSLEAVGGYVRVFVGDGEEKKDVTGRVRREAGSHVRTADSRDEDESVERKRNRARREDNEVSQQLNETVIVSSKKKRTRTPASGDSMRSIGPMVSLLATFDLIFFQCPGVPLNLHRVHSKPPTGYRQLLARITSSPTLYINRSQPKPFDLCFSKRWPH